jgi:hypothetical protein
MCLVSYLDVVRQEQYKSNLQTNTTGCVPWRSVHYNCKYINHPIHTKAATQQTTGICSYNLWCLQIIPGSSSRYEQGLCRSLVIKC